MNNDIFFEILKNLYKEGESALIEKLFIHNKLRSELRDRVKNFKKPITFEIKGKSVSLKCPLGTEIHWGDGKVCMGSPNISHHYNSKDIWRIRIFGKCNKLKMPKNLYRMYSLGGITSMVHMFRELEN